MDQSIEKFLTETHLLRDGWIQSVQERIDFLHSEKDKIDEEIVRLMQSVADMKKFTDTVAAVPRNMILQQAVVVETQIAHKLEKDSAGDN